VEIADDGQLKDPAEIAFKVDSWEWPKSTYPGGFLGGAGLGAPHIRMAPFSNRGKSRTPETLVHELGHLAMRLQDEYAPGANYCTEAQRSSLDPRFKAGGSRAACAMYNQFITKKLCSAHADSAHRGGNWQPWPCWTTVYGGYSDGSAFGNPSPPPRWRLRTPDLRGSTVGSLPTLTLTPGLLPKFGPRMNAKYPNLCKPFTWTTPWLTPSVATRGGDGVCTTQVLVGWLAVLRDRPARFRRAG
jgi:hypothetical protein